MSEQTLLKIGDIEITTKIARFGGISYQICNIGSIAIYTARKMNPIAVLMLVAAVVIGAFATSQANQQSDQTSMVVAIAAVLGIGAFIVQKFWPKHIFTLVLKTSSSDVQKIASEDREYLQSIQLAVEAAFSGATTEERSP
ncbi:DUF6232 family protein [Rhodopseudomonas palustris]|uniref:Uncharacterized protein n=1 Tax=Rhodopseudomonas palustris (strain BisB18) TaxID=316056 RepID=Q215K6_RHOPB